MNGVKPQVTNKKEQRRFSWWMIALTVFALPLIGFSVIVLTDVDPGPGTVQTVDHWLAEAQREDGWTWKARRLLYDKLPSDWATYLKLEHPGFLGDRQMMALEALAAHDGFVDASDRIVPALTNLLSQTGSEAIVSLTCNTLRRLGTNAIGAVPRLLALTSNTPPYGSGNALEALLAIAPSDPGVVRRATNILNDIVANGSQASATGSNQMLPFGQSGFVYVTVFAFPCMELPFAAMEDSFTAAYASQHPDLVQKMIQTLALNVQNYDTGSRALSTEQLSRLLSLWEQKASPPVKDVSIYYAIKAAAQREETQPMANRFFANMLNDYAVQFWRWKTTYVELMSSDATELRRLATGEVKNWIISKTADHPQDLGSLIETHFTGAEQNDPAIKEWVLHRTTAADNPNQIADWGRYLKMYGDVELSMEQPTVILRSDDPAKIAEMLRWLNSFDPANPFAELDLGYRARYGLESSEHQSPKYWLRRHLETLPRAKAINLLEQMQSAVESIDSTVKNQGEARERLAKLLNDFKQSPTDEN